MPAQVDSWLRQLPGNSHGLRVLPEPVALELARQDGSGWYVAPYATIWTVGKAASDPPQRFHVLDGEGEPLRFDTPEEARDYLERSLRAGLPAGAPLLALHERIAAAVFGGARRAQ